MGDYPYLIEFRLGPEKWKIRNLIGEYGKQFSVKTPRVPHLTLYGSFRLDREVHRDRTELYETVETIAENHRPLHYSVDGLELKKKSDGRYVFAFNIDSSASLRRLRDDLVEGLGEFSTPKNEWDETPGDVWFHITIANNLPKRKAKEIRSRLSGTSIKDRLLGLLGKRKEKLEEPLLPIDPLRLTVLYRRRILREYDLPTREWLDRSSALDWKRWETSLRLYRRERGFEQLDPATTNEDGPRTFVISDTHFHHSNIIKYCFRPFLRRSVDEMNRVLIDNWNRGVNPEDKVYFLGDLAYGRGAKDDEHYLRQLNGNIVRVKGNHDRDSDLPEHLEIDYGGIGFDLVHDPSTIDFSGNEWTIHGHHHNNHLRDHPFIDFEKRTVNVSVEVAGYSPVSLDGIVELIGAGENDSSVLVNYNFGI